MSKKIEFEYKDNKYVLEYNRESIRIMEKGGFDLNEFLKKPASNIDLAFQGAFLKNHRKIIIGSIAIILFVLVARRVLVEEITFYDKETNLLYKN